VSNVLSRSNAASRAPSGKRSVVAKGGGYAHSIDHQHYREKRKKGDRERKKKG
jgi:hypothetical protein